MSEKIKLTTGGPYRVKVLADEPSATGESKYGPWESWEVEVNGRRGDTYDLSKSKSLRKKVEENDPFRSGTEFWCQLVPFKTDDGEQRKCWYTEPVGPGNQQAPSWADGSGSGNGSAPRAAASSNGGGGTAPASDVAAVDILSVCEDYAEQRGLDAYTLAVLCASGLPLDRPDRRVEAFAARLKELEVVPALENWAAKHRWEIERLPDRERAQVREMYKQRLLRVREDYMQEQQAETQRDAQREEPDLPPAPPPEEPVSDAGPDDDIPF